MNLVEIMQELIKCREQEYLTDEDLAEEIKYWIKEYENKK